AVRRAVHARLVLRHALEHRRLRLGRCAVDLVGDHHVREHGARAELETARLLIEDAHSDHVGREEVRRELDAPDASAHDSAERLRQECLADARDVLEEQMAPGEQRDERGADGVVLAVQDAVHRGARLLRDGLDVRDVVVPERGHAPILAHTPPRLHSAAPTPVEFAPAGLLAALPARPSTAIPTRLHSASPLASTAGRAGSLATPPGAPTRPLTCAFAPRRGMRRAQAARANRRVPPREATRREWCAGLALPLSSTHLTCVNSIPLVKDGVIAANCGGKWSTVGASGAPRGSEGGEAPCSSARTRSGWTTRAVSSSPRSSVRSWRTAWC